MCALAKILLCIFKFADFIPKGYAIAILPISLGLLLFKTSDSAESEPIRFPVFRLIWVIFGDFLGFHYLCYLDKETLKSIFIRRELKNHVCTKFAEYSP